MGDLQPRRGPATLTDPGGRGDRAAEIVRRWLLLSAERVAIRAQELTALDAAIGDGDHGINLQRGFSRVAERLSAAAAEPDPLPLPPAPQANAPAQLLQLAGRTLVSTVGGASGPLYGTFFLELATQLDGPEAGDAAPADPARLGAALVAAAAAVGRRGRSTTGEKTMLDALVPAASAWSDAARGGAALAACAAAASRAAEDGRLATRPLVATKGRASYLGERSRGHLDPGATSTALLFEALADAVDQVDAGDGTRR